MTMKKQARWLLFCGIIFGLTACNLTAGMDTGVPGQATVQPYLTVSALLTQTSQAGLTTPNGETHPSHTPVVKSTASPASPVTLSPTASGLVLNGTPQAPPLLTPDPTPACDLASPGRPIDVTVPDDTVFHPGEYFSKTWRLVNAGTCPWEQSYSVLWFSGDKLGISHAAPLGQRVAPGKSIDITVDMLAPQQPGAYQSNWKLSNTRGDLFGIGSNGDAPFWVRIQVAPADTATPAGVEPSATPAPSLEPTLTPTLNPSHTPGPTPTALSGGLMAGVA